MNNLAFQIYGSTKSGIFQSTWKTDNAGTSASNQIELPLLSGGTYNFWIDWGDGSATNVTSYSQRTHTYASAGTYTVRITGIITGWKFNGGGDKLKILTVVSWGKLKLWNFYGCSNLILSGVTDIPDLSATTDLSAVFRDCISITTIGRLNEWDTSLVTLMEAMFYQSINFNQNISNWNVNKVNRMDNMFAGASKFNNGYASGIPNQLPWNINTTSTSVNINAMFSGATAFNSNLGTGTTPWDVSKVTNFASMFYGATNFNNGDDSAPINNWSINTVSSVSMGQMFQSSKFNRYIGDWNTSKVTQMGSMFLGASIFNNGLASGVAGTMAWNTGSCTNMSLMFYNATSFNQDIGLFNVSKVVSFAGMFWNCISYNNGDNINPINNWVLNTTVGANIDMSLMFRTQVAGTMKFNRPIDSWNVSEVTNMSNMFSRFNSAITSFNQPLANWERVGSSLAKVTNMSEMFSGSKLNYPIGNWNTSGVTNMYAMFLDNIEFNQDISTWNVSKVTNMQDMFYGATIFNQPIGSWNINTTSNVSMARMFLGASAFNQNIGNWNVSQVTNLTNFMSTKTPATYSSTNLDAIYNGWIVNGVQPNINISFGTAKYTAAGAAGRLTLTSAPNNWIITDGGL